MLSFTKHATFHGHIPLVLAISWCSIGNLILHDYSHYTTNEIICSLSTRDTSRKLNQKLVQAHSNQIKQITRGAGIITREAKPTVEIQTRRSVTFNPPHIAIVGKTMVSFYR